MERRVFPTEGQHADLLFFYCYCLKRKKIIENDSGFKQRGMKQKRTVLERRQLFFFLRDQRWYTMMPLSEVFCIVAHSDGALCFFLFFFFFFSPWCHNLSSFVSVLFFFVTHRRA